MPIPPLKRSSVERVLEALLPELDQIKAGPHESTKYDLLWKGHRFPPKVVVTRAVKIEHGVDLPESEFQEVPIQGRRMRFWRTCDSRSCLKKQVRHDCH
jgi:hypothetical protein